MRIEKIPIYKFDELSDEVKDKVITKFREGNDFPFLSDDLEEELKSLLEENKIEVLDGLKLYYSLSYSQGDGVCFVGNFKYGKCRISIEHKSNYVHYKSVNISIELYDDIDEEENEIYLSPKEHDDVLDEFKSIYKTICNKIEKDGYSIIENENTEEAIKDVIECNEYEFYKNGAIFIPSNVILPNNVTCPNCKKDTLIVERIDDIVNSQCNNCGFCGSEKLSFEDMMALDH